MAGDEKSPFAAFSGRATDAMPMGLIPALHARKDPDRPMITCDGVVTTRAELEARCNRRARAFERLNVGQDDLVAVLLTNGLEFYETLFAVWKLGATPGVISPMLP